MSNLMLEALRKPCQYRHAGAYRHPVKNIFSVTALATLLSLSACGTTVPKQFYLLAPTATHAVATTTSSKTRQLVISIGPVTLPEYLDRSQIVTRTSESELRLADGHRWAEPLAENFTRVLAEDLRALLTSGRVIVQPSREIAQADFRVTVDIVRFDADAAGQVTLIANWTFQNRKDPKVSDSQRAEHILNAGPGYPAQVAALSKAISLLSDDIYTAITAAAGE